MLQKRIILFTSFALLLTALILFYKDAQEMQYEDDLAQAVEAEAAGEDELLSSLILELATPLPDQTSYMKQYKIQKGDHLQRFLTRHVDDPVLVKKIISSAQEKGLHRKIKVGQPFFFFYESSLLKRIVWYPKPGKRVTCVVQNTTTVIIQEQNLERQMRLYTGRIEQSLYVDAAKAGAPQAAIRKFVSLISHNVDLQRSIHAGARFELMIPTYEDRETSMVFVDDLVFGFLETRDGSVDIYQFIDNHKNVEYFSGKGQGTRKALLRTPVPGARISSTFGTRKHPILGYSKMHRGIDFAAGHGTPIYAAGDGVIERASAFGTYGNYIRIRHNNEYSTAYAHLSRFAKGMRPGRKVKQGELIGYVGTTGRSSGPHLHYEVLRKGAQINPKNIKMPSRDKLTGKELAAFKKTKASIDAGRKKIKAGSSLNA